MFDQDVDEAMAVMGEWYDGYRFAKGTTNDVYNTDMVLYYLKASIPNDQPPDNLIDCRSASSVSPLHGARPGEP